MACNFLLDENMELREKWVFGVCMATCKQREGFLTLAHEVKLQRENEPNEENRSSLGGLLQLRIPRTGEFEASHGIHWLRQQGSLGGRPVRRRPMAKVARLR